MPSQSPDPPNGWRGLVLLLALGACAPAAVPAAERPRLVVLIVLDTLAAGHVSHLGYDRATTPALDALAREGLCFSEAIAPASYTVASVPSLMTGRLPDRHGLVDYLQRLPEEETTLAELLRAAGYRTFGAVAVANSSADYGNDQGFDEFALVYAGAGGPEMDTYEFHGRAVHFPTPLELAPIAAERLDRLQPGERLFLYLHGLQPHGPYDPPEPYKQLFRDARYPGPYREGDRLRAQEQLASGAPSAQDVEEIVHLYDANVRWADDGLAAVLDALRARGLFDEALIVVTSDHGEAFWQHGHVGHGEEVYEEYVRVPLVVKPPGGLAAPGARIGGMVSTLDLVPSVCEWLALELPAAPLDGRSLGPLAPGPALRPTHAELLLRAEEDCGRVALRHPPLALVGQLARDRAGERVLRELELYDLSADPLQQDDLAARRPAQAAHLADRLLARLAEVERARPLPKGRVPAAELMLLETLGYTGIEER